MKVSVVIPSFYEVDKDYLKVCVESLRATVDWDIIVVTNGTNTKPRIDDIHGITNHLHTRDQGQCIATNIGAQAVSPNTDYIMVVNSDMYFPKNWGKDLVNDNYLCFSPNLVEPENNAGSAMPFLKLDAGFTLDEFKPALVEEFVNQRTMMPETDTTGFNLPFFIRIDVWDAIGGYDTKYDPWGSNSDTDLQTKIELAGIQPMRVREMMVYHFSNKSGIFDGTHMTEWWHNFDYYRDKWGFTRDDEPKPDTWMAIGMVNKEMNKYHPDWEGKYAS